MKKSNVLPLAAGEDAGMANGPSMARRASEAADTYVLAGGGGGWWTTALSAPCGDIVKPRCVVQVHGHCSTHPDP